MKSFEDRLSRLEELNEKIHVGIVIAGLSVAIATGVYDYRLENRQKERQKEDRERQQQWREEDVRQQELHDQKRCWIYPRGMLMHSCN